MKRFLLCVLFWGALFSVNVHAETETTEPPIEIQDSTTPEAGIRKSTKMLYYFAGMSMVVVAAGAVVISNRSQTSFSLDTATRNFDGSYKVTISVDNKSKKPLKMNEDDGLNIVSGSVLILNNQITSALDPGKNECAFVAIINEDSEFELKVGKSKFNVSGKEISKHR